MQHLTLKTNCNKTNSCNYEAAAIKVACLYLNNYIWFSNDAALGFRHKQNLIFHLVLTYFKNFYMTWKIFPEPGLFRAMPIL